MSALGEMDDDIDAGQRGGPIGRCADIAEHDRLGAFRHWCGAPQPSDNLVAVGDKRGTERPADKARRAGNEDARHDFRSRPVNFLGDCAVLH
jgi:hypothetical protein